MIVNVFALLYMDYLDYMLVKVSVRVMISSSAFELRSF